MVPQTREFDQWFDEVREMMHREVNYHVEAATTRRFAERLKDDERYIVPTIVDEYCTDQVLCMTFERGVPINSPVMLSFLKNAAISSVKLHQRLQFVRFLNGAKCKLTLTLVTILFV